jgi:signal transduction histidine kinase
VSVLLSVSCLPPQFGGQVYVATDLTPHKEVQRLNELKTVFQRAAMEGRVPLSLAVSTLQLHAMGSDDLKGVVDKVQRYLARADLPLERLMRLFSAEHRLLSRPYADMVDAVHVTLLEFPRMLHECLRLNLPQEAIPVKSTFDDLQFCIESLISFGIRTMPQAELLDVTVERRGENVRLAVSGNWVPSIELGLHEASSDRWRRKAIADLTLGNAIIERIVEKYGGSYNCEFEYECRMVIEFPQFAG